MECCGASKEPCKTAQRCGLPGFEEPKQEPPPKTRSHTSSSKSVGISKNLRKCPSSARPAGRCFLAWCHAFILLFFRICMISEKLQRFVKTTKPNSALFPTDHSSKCRPHGSGFPSLYSTLARFSAPHTAAHSG